MSIFPEDYEDFDSFIRGEKAESIEEDNGKIILNFKSGNSIIFYTQDGQQLMEVI
jgi:hypothetical protein